MSKQAGGAQCILMQVVAGSLLWLITQLLRDHQVRDGDNLAAVLSSEQGCSAASIASSCLLGTLVVNQFHI